VKNITRKNSLADISKFIAVFLASVFAGLFVHSAQSIAETQLLKIQQSSIELLSDTASGQVTNFTENSIESNLLFHQQNDNGDYKITVKNTDSKNYLIEGISDNNEHPLISYSYDNQKGRRLNAGESFDFYVKANYDILNTEIPERTQLNSVKFTIDYSEIIETPDTPSSTDTPNTGDKLTLNLFILITSAAGAIICLLTIRKKSKVGKLAYIFAAAFAAPILLFSTSSYAETKHSNDFNLDTNFELMNLLVVKYEVDGVEQEKILNYGESFTDIPSIPDKRGYTSLGWAQMDDKFFDPEAGVLADQSLTPKYEIINYAISYTGLNNDEKTTINNPLSYTVNDSISLNNPTTRVDSDGDPTQSFIGWLKESGEITSSVSFENEIGNKAFEAKWEDIAPTNYNIEYDLNGGDTQNRISFTKHDADFTIENPSKEGYTFIGWSGTDLEGNNNLSVKVKKGTRKNLSFEAHYRPNQYSFTFNGNGSDTGEMNTANFNYDQANNLPANGYGKTGYSFTNWNTKADGSGDDFANEAEILNYSNTDGYELTLYAQWRQNKYNISFDKNSSSATGSMSAILLDYEDETRLPGNEFVRDDADFMGWNTKADGSGDSYNNRNIISKLSAIDNDTITLYALWDEYEFYLPNSTTFDGTNNIETNVALFSEENLHKDFVVRFTIEESSNSIAKSTIFSNMNESGSPWPGIVFRHESANTIVGITANSTERNDVTESDFTPGMNIIIRRTNDKIYVSFDDGKSYTFIEDFAGFTAAFNVTATFGSGKDASGRAFRYSKDTLSNMSIQLYDAQTYKLNFDTNSGGQAIFTRDVDVNEDLYIPDSDYTMHNYRLDHWSTEPDDSGTRFDIGQITSNIVNAGEELTLYAIWRGPLNYNISYDANGGEGSMNNQSFPIDEELTLASNSFTKDGKVFGHWNTKADGSGESYIDGATIRDPGDQHHLDVTLYAIWASEAYSYTGTRSFNGTSDYIDTGISLFNTTNHDKDFEISFEIINNAAVGSQRTILNSMRESSPYPGFVFRNDNSSLQFGDGKKDKRYAYGSISRVIIKRESGKLYIKTDADSDFVFLSDASSVVNFDTTVTIGSSLNSSNAPWRYFQGELANIYVNVY